MMLDAGFWMLDEKGTKYFPTQIDFPESYKEYNKLIILALFVQRIISYRYARM